MIVFRVDASIQMGTGHVMRCLTLADALSRQGAKCEFICREHPGHLNALITQRGYKVHALAHVEQSSPQMSSDTAALAHAHWLGATQEEDYQACAPLIQSVQPDWLIVDHYALDERWQKEMRPFCQKTMVIDDLADRQHDCDLLLDQTFGRNSDDYKPFVPEHCQLLCGAEYALLRPEFVQWRAYSLKRRENGQLEHLLINLGGVDKDNITTQILQALSNASLPKNCRITVVMGATAPWVKEVEEQAAQMLWPTEVKVGVSNMAELMANSDLAIGAAGATSWERCCLGLPTIMIVLADNQKLIAQALANNGVIIPMYDAQQLPSLMINASSKLNELSQRSAKISDGTGVFKVHYHLLEGGK